MMRELAVRTSVRLDDIEQCLIYWGVKEEVERRDILREHAYLLSEGNPMCVAVEERDRIVGLFICVFVSEEFYQACAEAPEPFVMRRLDAWKRSERVPLLNDKAVARANAGDGLSLMLTTFGAWDGETYDRLSIFHRLVERFVQDHRGYRLKRIFGEPANQANLDHMLAQGYVIINDYAEWHSRNGTVPPPALVAVDRETANELNDYLLGIMFDYQVPRLGLSRGEQIVLTEAIRGGTDASVADRLALSADTVRRHLRSVYDRFDVAMAGYLPPRVGTGRGPERRTRVLEYLSRHPEELRPYNKSQR
jgi:hypothetical protein